MYSTPLNDLAWRPTYAVTVWGKTQKAEKKRKSAGPKLFKLFSTNLLQEIPERLQRIGGFWGCNPLEEFPGTVELELTKTQIPTIPYKHYDEKSEFHLDPLQQFLGMLQLDPSQFHSNLFTMAPL
mgnify:CR=1 FL=1